MKINRIDEKHFTRLAGEKIRVARQDINISQEKLARRTGLSEKHIGTIERGEKAASYYTMVTLCEALQIDIGEITQDIKREAKQEPNEE